MGGEVLKKRRRALGDCDALKTSRNCPLTTESIGNVPIARTSQCEKTSLSLSGSHCSVGHEGEWSILHRAPRRARRRRRGVGLAAIPKTHSSSWIVSSAAECLGWAPLLMDCRMKPRAALTTAMTALLLLAIPFTAVAAPTYRERYKCYEPCRAHCADRYSCENRNATRNCFTNFNKCKSLCRTRCYH